MKRLVYNLLAIFCFALVSCTEEVLVPDYSKDHIVLNVFNSPMTKAAGDLNTDYERQLNRLDCFFYVKDQTDQPCVYYHKLCSNFLHRGDASTGLQQGPYCAECVQQQYDEGRR